MEVLIIILFIVTIGASEPCFTDTCVGCVDDCLEPAVSCEDFPADDPDYCG